MKGERQKKIVAFVPIKSKSARFKGENKNLKELNRKPLIHYIIKTLIKVKEAGYIDDIYVFCDEECRRACIDKNIEENNYDFKFIIENVESTDSKGSINEVLREFANKETADIYVLTHATAPFIKPESFEKAIEKVKSCKYDSALSVVKKYDFIWNYCEEKNNFYPINYNPFNIPRTQDLRPYYVETCGLYVYTRESIMKGSRIGSNPYLLEVSGQETCDINTPEDFKMAEIMSRFA